MATRTREISERVFQVRFNGRCRKCGAKRSLLATIEQRREHGYDFRGFYHRTTERCEAIGASFYRAPVKGFSVECECGANLGLLRVTHVTRHDGGHECDPRCMGATGPNCECKCGGLNHGGANG